MEPSISFEHILSFEKDKSIYIPEIQDDLRLYHYKKVNDTNDDFFLKQVRGIVFDSNNNLVMRGFPYTPEYIADENLKNVFTQPLTNFKVYHSQEGTIIRVFFHNKWHVSTHKRLNASHSRWGGGTDYFEDIFRRGVEHTFNIDYEMFFNNLDKTRQYMFLVTPTKDTRIVSCVHPLPKVFHVGTFVNNKFTMENLLQTPDPMVNNYMTEIIFTDLDQLVNYVSSLNPLYTQGVILMGESGFYKIVSKQYSMLCQVRGNQSNLELRYLQIANNTDMRNMFCSLYPESYQSVEKKIMNVARHIHSVYIKRFVKKQFAVVLPIRYGIIKKCHSYYTTQNSPVTLQVVLRILISESPEKLLRIIS